MDFSKIPLFQALSHKMSWLGQRQQVLARNIANVNTPGYKPKDLEAPDFGAILRGATPDGSGSSGSRGAAGGAVPLYVTHANHIGASPSGDAIPAGTVEVVQPDAPSRPSGNAVMIEHELMKVGKTAMDYELTTSIYRRYVAMFRTAIGRGGGG